jgi:succinate dehydrogenase/fumarate reductase cytochrome b subunit
MNDHTQCPACRSLCTHVTKGDFKASGFQAFGNRVCDQCGTAWRPRCPRWAAIVSIVTGCAMLGGFLAVAWPDLQRYGLASFFESARASGKTIKPLKGFAILVVVALWACFYGVAVLLGRAGKMEILGKVLAPPAAPEISEPDSSSNIP